MDKLTEARAVVAPKRRVSSDTLMTDSLTLEPPPTRQVAWWRLHGHSRCKRNDHSRLGRRRTRLVTRSRSALWLVKDRADKKVARAGLPTTHAQQRGNLGPMANLVRDGLHNQLSRRHRTTVLSDLYLLRNVPPLGREGSQECP